MSDRKKIIERIDRLNEAIDKARDYLVTGDHSNWRGFRPLFGDSRNRLPHPDWIANVFLP
jgi:hypothetical protein